jgi:hypothetical protein
MQTKASKAKKQEERKQASKQVNKPKSTVSYALGCALHRVEANSKNKRKASNHTVNMRIVCQKKRLTEVTSFTSGTLSRDAVTLSLN